MKKISSKAYKQAQGWPTANEDDYNRDREERASERDHSDFPFDRNDIDPMYESLDGEPPAKYDQESVDKQRDSDARDIFYEKLGIDSKDPSLASDALLGATVADDGMFEGKEPRQGEIVGVSGKVFIEWEDGTKSKHTFNDMSNYDVTLADQSGVYGVDESSGRDERKRKLRY